MEKTTLIPLFPLSLVVVPGETLPLHIFEPRYRQMIADCREGDADGSPHPFGISFSEDNEIAPVGCTVRLASIAKEYEDGRFDIVTRGEFRYRLTEVDHSKAYYQARVIFFEDEPDETFDMTLRDEVRQLHVQLIERVKGKPPSLSLSDDEPASFTLAASAGISGAEKQALLPLTSENQRMHILRSFYHKTLASLDEAKDIQARIKANGFFRTIRSTDLG